MENPKELVIALQQKGFSSAELVLMSKILHLCESVESGKERLTPDSYKPEIREAILAARETFLSDFDQKINEAKNEFYSIFQRKEN